MAMFGECSRGLPKGDASPALDRRHRRRFTALGWRAEPTALLNVAYDALVESDAIDHFRQGEQESRRLADASAERASGGIDLREALSAIRWMSRSGCAWRMPPIRLPPWRGLLVVSPVRRPLLFRAIEDAAAMIDRQRSGRNAGPSAAFVRLAMIRLTVNRLTRPRPPVMNPFFLGRL